MNDTICPYIFLIFYIPNRDDEECMEEIVRESISSNEDEREEAELKIRERGMDIEQSESQEEKDYKAEFFELLDEVKIKSK